jgi:tripartite ATP-independent transporter DctM subunit
LDFIELLPLFMLLALVVVVLFGFPVAFSIGALALIFGLPTLGVEWFYLLPLRIYGVMNSLLLISVPLFVFMGVMLERSGLAEDLLETLAIALGKVPGSMALSVTVMGAILAASTGIIGATVVTMTVLALPTMLRRGYSPELATGTICSAGTLGQIIPPSIVLLLLASIANNAQVTVGSLFSAALIPGLMLTAGYMVYIFFFALRHPEKAPAIPFKERDIPARALIKRMFRALIPPAVLVLSVLGSIFAGLASPTEAAAVGAFGATALAVINRKLTWQVLRGVMQTTVRFTSMVFIILTGATAFGLVFRGLHGDRLLREFFLGLDVDAWVILAIVMLVLFILGFFLDFIEITFIHIPILIPIMDALGVNPLWFMILVAINLQTSFLTPPFGFALFYLKGAAPHGIELKHVYRGIIPFVIVQLIGLALVILFPQIALWLPSHF